MRLMGEADSLAKRLVGCGGNVEVSQKLVGHDCDEEYCVACCRGFWALGLLSMPWDWLTGIYVSKNVTSLGLCTDVDWLDERRGT